MLRVRGDQSGKVRVARRGWWVLPTLRSLGRGVLVPRRVTRLYHNTTAEWLRLRWTEGGEARELVTTPGHSFLDASGHFLTIEALTREGRATVVLASGGLTEGVAGRLHQGAQIGAGLRGASQLAPGQIIWIFGSK